MSENSKQIIYVSGLPRAGSTLLCQLLGMHNSVDSNGHSSPLLPTITQIRHNLSDNEFMLSQLDCNFNEGYQRIEDSLRGLLFGWFKQSKQSFVVDKNRGWLKQVEMLNALDSNFKMLICIREPSQIYGSIESQHQKTILLDFPDHLANLSRFERAKKLFDSDGIVGAPLHSIAALQDIPQEIQKKLYYVVFEDLMQNTQRAIQDIFSWLGLPKQELDLENLEVKAHESDSYYRFKYRHKTKSKILPPKRHEVSTRIKKAIEEQYIDFYKLFYPGIIN